MKGLTCFTILAGVASHAIVNAQAPVTQPIGSEVDLSGVYVAVYVGAPDTVVLPDVYPFTAAAERAFNAFDPGVGDPRIGNDCAPMRMPAILWSPNPMEIVQEDRRVVMRFEQNDTVRSIPLDGPAAPANQPYTELGYSVAYWAGDVLTIETTHMLGGVIVNDMGQPISRDARLTERYWREPGENDLQVEVLVEDAINYTEPLRLERVWTWSPDEQILPWQCFSLDPRESEALDIEELARMLEQL
jgi:hypothetical protein